MTLWSCDRVFLKIFICKPQQIYHNLIFQNIVFVYDCLEEERMKSCNTTAKQMETNQFHNTRSFNTNQLQKQDFKKKNMAASLYWANVYQTGTYSNSLYFYTSPLLVILPNVFSISILINLSLFSFSFLSFLLPFSLSSPTQELDLILKVLS